jgi:hypothetical protein
MVEKLLCPKLRFTFSEEATMIRVNMTTGDLESIMREHHIPALEWGEWSALVFQGKRPGATLLAHLRRGNRGAALQAVLSELSKGVAHRFPPKDWQPALRKAS